MLGVAGFLLSLLSLLSVQLGLKLSREGLVLVAQAIHANTCILYMLVNKPNFQT